MTLSEDRARAQEMLGEYKNHRGELDIRKVSEESFILLYGIEKRLECGDKELEQVKTAIARCPVSRGEKKFEEVHIVPKEPLSRASSAADTLNVQGKINMKTIILIIIVIALIAVGGAAAAAQYLGTMRNMDVNTALAVFWATFLAGMGYSYELYYKARKKEGEDFEWSKMRRTAIVSVAFGLVTAIVSYWRGIGLDEADVWLTTSGAMGFIIMLVDQAIAIYLKKTEPPAPAPAPETRGGG